MTALRMCQVVCGGEQGEGGRGHDDAQDQREFGAEVALQGAVVKKRGAKGWDKATALLRKHGPWAVFVGRLVPIGLVQSMVPAVAGAAHMPYRTLLPPMVAGAACSAAMPLLIGIGVAAGLKDASGLGLIIVGVLLVLVAVFVIRKRHRAKAITTDTSLHDSDHGPDPEREPAHRA
ncbi:hypothetical protein [Nonomuraea sp. NPDC049750]|uniref:DedA family protein n=1 Tax=Nonomuraea sp. NPDC049750 TaxID=3154738 RepID=UPI00340A2767